MRSRLVLATSLSLSLLACNDEGGDDEAASGGDDSAEQLCVDTINDYRATLDLPTDLPMHSNLATAPLLIAAALLSPLCGQCVTLGGATVAMSPTMPGMPGPGGPIWPGPNDSGCAGATRPPRTGCLTS